MASGSNGANLAYAEVLTCGEDGLEPSLLLSIERRATYGVGTTVLRRYLFDAPEEIVRFCGTHKVKLSSLAGVFFATGRGAAGLPELVLGAAEQGLAKLHVRGPAGVVQFTKTVLETLSNPRSVQVLPGEATPGPHSLCYEDEYLTITAVAPNLADDSLGGNAHKRPHAGSVGYSCRLRHGGTELLVLPSGEKASPWLCTGDARPPFVFYLGRRPRDAGEHEIGVSGGGRRRELWKSKERLLRWQALCPGLAQTYDQAPSGYQKETPIAGVSQSPVLRAYLFPRAQLEAGNEEAIDDKAIKKESSEECQEWTLSKALEEASEKLIAAASKRQNADPELLFLGTGSAKPSSRRGQSGILFKLDNFTALLDCGGGTWAQLVRLLGEEAARDAIDELDVVWISHHHADHCAGLPAVLGQRSKPGIRVFGSQRVLRFWRASLEFAGCGRGGAIAAPSICAHKDICNPQRKIAVCPEWPETFRSVAVPHCPESYALVLRAGETQFVYSGDCRPSEELVKIAEEASAEGLRTWLVHEATFDAEEVANAIAAKHSTIPEALDVAMRMGATGVLLTHFSQRYASIGLNPEGEADNTAREEAIAKKSLCRGTHPKALVASLAAGAAFDGLRIHAAQMDAFGEARPVFEQYWAKRHDKSELKKRTEMPEERQPLPGAIIPRACFQVPQENASTRPVDSNSGIAEHLDAPTPSLPSDTKLTPTLKLVPAALADRLRLFYLQVNPEKVSDAPGVARLFAGREVDLNVKLHSRYGKDLRSEGLIAPEASSSEASDSDSDDEDMRPPPKIRKTLQKTSEDGSTLPELTMPLLPTPPPSLRRPETKQVLPEAGEDRILQPSPLPLAHVKQLNHKESKTSDSPMDPPSPPPTPLASTQLPPAPPPPLAATLHPPAPPPPPPVSILLPPPPAPPLPTPPLVSTRSLPPAPAPPPPTTTTRQFQFDLGQIEDNTTFRMKPKPPEEVGLAEKLRSFYLQHNPAKVGDADKVARLFASKVDELNVKLRANYAGADLSTCAGSFGIQDEEVPPWRLGDSDSE